MRKNKCLIAFSRLLMLTFQFITAFLPENLNVAVLKSLNIKKPIIIHYMQPHAPYFGEPSLILNSNEIYRKAQEGEISADFLRKAYIGNLRKVLRDGGFSNNS